MWKRRWMQTLYKFITIGNEFTINIVFLLRLNKLRFKLSHSSRAHVYCTVALSGDFSGHHAPRKGDVATQGECGKEHVGESCSPCGNGHFALFSNTDTLNSFVRIILIRNSLVFYYTVLLNLRCGLRIHMHTQVTTKFLLRSPSTEKHYSCLFLLTTQKLTFWTSYSNCGVPICTPSFWRSIETGYKRDQQKTKLLTVTDVWYLILLLN